MPDVDMRHTGNSYTGYIFCRLTHKATPKNGWANGLTGGLSQAPTAHKHNKI